MKLSKRLLAASVAALTVLSLSACGGQEETSSAAPSSQASQEPASETVESSSAETITITVGASPAPHAEILENIKPLLAKEGIELVIEEFTDYVIPNEALDAGDIDANYFQHYPYLADFNAKNGTDMVAAAYIHFEPMGIYPGRTATLEELQDGASIAVPNDPTNEARALLLLQKLGFITLKDGAGLEATPLDIVDNPHNIEFIEMEAVQLPTVLADVDFAVINGNYAVGAGIGGTMLDAEDKDSEAAQEFANILAVRNGDETRPEIQKLVEALQSEENATFIEQKYEGSVIPVF